MKITPILADAEGRLIIIGIGLVLSFLIIVIRTVAAQMGVSRKLRKAEESTARGDWKKAAALYKEVIASCLSDEESVKLCVTKLEDVYRRGEVKADLSRVYQFHKVCADIYQSKTLSDSKKRDMAEQSVEELRQFLAQYP